MAPQPPLPPPGLASLDSPPPGAPVLRPSPAPAPEPAAPTNTFVFTGSSVGAPSAAPDLQPAAAASVLMPPPPSVEAEESNDEFDATVVSDRRSASGWKIVLADGSQQGVSGQVLVGRQVKVADPRWPAARLLSVADTTKSVSKVHALLEADASGFWITDLGSTNGVIISLADGTEVDLDATSRGEVPPGSEIVLGNYVLKVDRD